MSKRKNSNYSIHNKKIKSTFKIIDYTEATNILNQLYNLKLSQSQIEIEKADLEKKLKKLKDENNSLKEKIEKNKLKNKSITQTIHQTIPNPKLKPNDYHMSYIS